MVEIGWQVFLIGLSAVLAAGLGAISMWIRKVDDRQFEFAKHYVTRAELSTVMERVHADLKELQQIVREEARATRQMSARLRSAYDEKDRSTD